MRNPNCTICGLAALRPVKLFSDDELVCRGCYNKQIKQNAALVELCKSAITTMYRMAKKQENIFCWQAGDCNTPILNRYLMGRIWMKELKQIIGEE